MGVKGTYFYRLHSGPNLLCRLCPTQNNWDGGVSDKNVICQGFTMASFGSPEGSFPGRKDTLGAHKAPHDCRASPELDNGDQGSVPNPLLQAVPGGSTYFIKCANTTWGNLQVATSRHFVLGEIL